MLLINLTCGCFWGLQCCERGGARGFRRAWSWQLDGECETHLTVQMKHPCHAYCSCKRKVRYGLKLRGNESVFFPPRQQCCRLFSSDEQENIMEAMDVIALSLTVQNYSQHSGKEKKMQEEMVECLYFKKDNFMLLLPASETAALV